MVRGEGAATLWRLMGSTDDRGQGDATGVGNPLNLRGKCRSSRATFSDRMGADSEHIETEKLSRGTIEKTM
jgi:hypothetical protein